MSQWYSAAIRIKGGRRGDLGTGSLSTRKANEFMQTTKACLDAVKATKTGARLIAEINASNHTVDIYRTWAIDEGNYQGGDSEQAGVSMVVELDTVHPDGSTELHNVLSMACQDLSHRSKLQKLFRVGKARPRFLNRDSIARLVGISSRDLKSMESGKKAIDARTDAKLRVYLYDFLSRGTGESCYVVFNHKRDNLSDRHKRYLPSSHNWEHRPPAVALAHELIHAWRVMTGQVLFEYGWEEEAMTVGLPPFGNMPLSENRVRVEWGGLAVRPDYQNIDPETDLVDPAQAGLDPDNMAWQGDQRALHPQQNMARTAAQRRRAMGYDDDDGF